MTFMRNIVVVPYDPRWPGRFAEESAQVADRFADNAVAIHHIGSTSVPGLAAKPVIDMLLVVKDIEAVDHKDDEMAALGYVAKGEFGIAGRRYFPKGPDDARTFHLHTYEDGHGEIRRHLEFRDYLIAHPEDAARYGELKVELAARFRDDAEGYMAGKDPLICETLVKAVKWAEQQRR